MELTNDDRTALERLGQLAKENKIDIAGGKLRRTSSRFCLGVEHGDYNGTELFGVGTDRFLQAGLSAQRDGQGPALQRQFPKRRGYRVHPRERPGPEVAEIAETWGRFPYGIDYILQREGLQVRQGIDGVLFGNIRAAG